MAASLKLLPGNTVRWRGRRYLIVNYESLDPSSTVSGILFRDDQGDPANNTYIAIPYRDRTRP